MSDERLEHFAELTPDELERLALLAEECGEVIQVIGKIMRHGYESFSPLDVDQITNRSLLQKELGHVGFAQKLMCELLDLTPEAIASSRKAKRRTVKPYLHHHE